MLALAIAAMLGGPVAAQPRDILPEDVEHYVLALSWSPSFCETQSGNAERLQCGREADFHFVVHGLWPNTDDDSPSFCRSRARDPSRREVDGMLDIMPSPGLVRHQWRKHGRCSGLSARDYFALVRGAYERVAIPPGLTSLKKDIDVRPEVLRAAFRQANPGLRDDGIYVRCERRQLVEVRICLDPDLNFQSCPNVRRSRCRADLIDVPAPD